MEKTLFNTKNTVFFLTFGCALLESTRMAAELDLDPISKFRARTAVYTTRTRRAQPVEPARSSGANFEWF